MTGKASALLRYLIERAGQVVTKEELFAAVWPDTVVSDAALTSCIQEVRHALHDHARKPRYLETVHRRGFRFLGKEVSSQQEEANQKSKGKGQNVKVRLSFPTPSSQHSTPTLVGRDAELAQLHAWLEKALSGERQLVFVTGEPGIGKTTVVEAFLSQVAANGNIWIGRGQCVEHYGAGEACLPILEALGRLCREPGGGHLIVLLSQYALTWLVQMPALLGTTEMKESYHEDYT